MWNLLEIPPKIQDGLLFQAITCQGSQMALFFYVLLLKNRKLDPLSTFWHNYMQNGRFEDWEQIVCKSLLDIINLDGISSLKTSLDSETELVKVFW